MFEFIYFESYRQPDVQRSGALCRERVLVVEPLDHDVSGLDEGGDRVAFFEVQFADGLSGDDGGDVAVSDGHDDLGEESFDAEGDDFSGELIAPADAAVALARLGLGPFIVFVEERLKGSGR